MILAECTYFDDHPTAIPKPCCAVRMQENRKTPVRPTQRLSSCFEAGRYPCPNDTSVELVDYLLWLYEFLEGNIAGELNTSLFPGHNGPIVREGIVP